MPLTFVNKKQLGFKVEKEASKHPGTSAKPLISWEINLNLIYPGFGTEYVYRLNVD